MEENTKKQIELLEEELENQTEKYNKLLKDKSIPEEILKKEFYKKRTLKTKITCLKKYGVDNPSKSNIIKNKIKNHFKEKYGVDNPGQIPEVKEKIKNHFLKKYGQKSILKVPEVQLKIKQTMMNKYGVLKPMDSLEIKNNLKKTVKEKYGTDFYFQSKDAKEKIKKSMIKRFGVDHHMKNKEFEKKWTKNFKKKYGVKRPLQIESIKKSMENRLKEKRGYIYNLENLSFQKKIVKARLSHITNFEDYYNLKSFLINNPKVTTSFLTEYFNISIYQLRAALRARNITHLLNDYQEYSKYSQAEQIIKSFLDDNKIKYSSHNRDIIPPLEIDFFLPELNIGIEVNPSFTHTIKNEIWNINLNKNYHLDKFNQCKEKNIKLITLFEWMDYELILDSLILKETKKIPTGYFSTNNALGTININNMEFVSTIPPKKHIHNNFEVYDCGITLWKPVKNKEKR